MLKYINCIFVPGSLGRRTEDGGRISALNHVLHPVKNGLRYYAKNTLTIYILEIMIFDGLILYRNTVFKDRLYGKLPTKYYHIYACIRTGSNC